MEAKQILTFERVDVEGLAGQVRSVVRRQASGYFSVRS